MVMPCDALHVESQRPYIYGVKHHMVLDEALHQLVFQALRLQVDSSCIRKIPESEVAGGQHGAGEVPVLENCCTEHVVSCCSAAGI